MDASCCSMAARRLIIKAKLSGPVQLGRNTEASILERTTASPSLHTDSRLSSLVSVIRNLVGSFVEAVAVLTKVMFIFASGKL